MFIPALPARNPAVGGIRFEPLFSEIECDEILRAAEGLPLQEGKVGGHGPGSAVVSKVRSVLEQRLPVDPSNGYPLVRILSEICRINSELWYFDLVGFVPDDEPGLLTYRGATGDHYAWHIDVGRGKTSSRKLGFTIQLSASEEYEGGDLEFHDVASDHEAFRRKGTMLVFPAYWLHRVTPTTRGTRRVIVGWIHGPSFR